jgi:hypothetical protein
MLKTAVAIVVISDTAALLLRYTQSPDPVASRFWKLRKEMTLGKYVGGAAEASSGVFTVVKATITSGKMNMHAIRVQTANQTQAGKIR